MSVPREIPTLKPGWGACARPNDPNRGCPQARFSLNDLQHQLRLPPVVPPGQQGSRTEFSRALTLEDSMKKSSLSDSQILAVLKQAEAGCHVPELCREHGVSSATFYKWCSRRWGD